MKLPYIKLYTADLLAAGRNLTAQQLGEAVLGICEQAFENDTAYTPSTRRETVLFELLTQWKNEAQESYQQNKKKMKKARSVRWKKQENPVGQLLKDSTPASGTQHTETETKTETETDTETETENINTFTAPAPAAQDKSDFSQEGEMAGEAGHHLLALSPLAKKTRAPQTLLQQFAEQVSARFEPDVKTDVQKGIWFKRNCRCLSDILKFCEQNIPLALQTISVCAKRLEKAGLTGGYEAVCRNLPEYYAKAQQILEDKEK